MEENSENLHLGLKKMKRSNRKQHEVLVNFMSENIDFAMKKSPLDKVPHAKMWVELSKTLNKYGPTKTPEQWRKVWKDLKRKVRMKNARLMAEKKRIGDEKGREAPLSRVEEMIFDIMKATDSTSMLEIPTESANKVPAIAYSGDQGDEEVSELVEVEVDSEGDEEGVLSNAGITATPRINVESAQPSRKLTDSIYRAHSALEESESRHLKVMENVAASMTSMSESLKEMVKLLKEVMEGQKKIHGALKVFSEAQGRV